MTLRRPRTSILLTAFAWGALVLSIPAVPMISLAGPVAAADGGGSAGAEGETIFTDQKCATCHDLSSIGVEAKVKEGSAMYGGDLAEATITPDRFDEIAAYLRQETELDGEKHNKKIGLSDAEMTTLLEWLAAQSE